MKDISILGSTGSVGAATLDVVRGRADLFRVNVLTAQQNVQKLAEQARATNARLAVIGDETLYQNLKAALGNTKTEIAAGRQALIDAAGSPAAYTMAAIVGMAGLEPLLSAIRNSKCVAIANKEPLVAAGALVKSTATKHNTTLLPVDSEHNAVFQILDPAQKANLRRIILTASGGPFRTWTYEQMLKATPAQAIAHPTWSMGAKISVDSATMMNKALELIEAHMLFGLPPDKIEVIVHPQSIVHAMAEYVDGSVLAHLGAADMRVPIGHTLGWPDRIETSATRLDLTQLSGFTFESVDHCRFPAINLAYDILRAGGAGFIALNAANEVAVAAFLAGGIAFPQIVDTVRRVTESGPSGNPQSLDDILGMDREMRELARLTILKLDDKHRKAS